MAFGLLSVAYSYRKLKRPVLELLRGKSETVGKVKKYKQKQNSEMTFLQELKQSTVRSHFTLVFFIAFASFCYSDMMQMSFSMDELASPMFAAILIIIGIILACTTLFLAVTTVIKEFAPEYSFDVKAFIIVLISFVLKYEAIMFSYAGRIKKISIKEVMME